MVSTVLRSAVKQLVIHLVQRLLERCKTIRLDVTEPFPTIRQAAADAVKLWGRIDVLVHNAANGMLGIVEEVGLVRWRLLNCHFLKSLLSRCAVGPSAEGYQKQFDTNFFGPLNVTNAFLPYMRAARSGVIVFIGSRSSYRSNVLVSLVDYGPCRGSLINGEFQMLGEECSYGLEIGNSPHSPRSIQCFKGSFIR